MQLSTKFTPFFSKFPAKLSHSDSVETTMWTGHLQEFLDR